MRLVKRQLQSEHFDLIVDSQGLLKSALFAKWAGAPIAGLDKRSAREAWAAYFYQQSYAVPKGQDAVWRNRQLLAQIFDYSITDNVNFGLELPIDGSGCLQDLPKHYYVALHATSRDSKFWLMDHWLNLFQRLYESDGLPILLPWGSPIEQQRAQQMAAALPFVQVCPRLSLLQLAGVLKQSRAVVGVDTGLLHLANAVDCPLVGIYTDSDPIKTGVQTSAWAANIGGVGQMPNVDEVFDLLKDCIKNKLQAA